MSQASLATLLADWRTLLSAWAGSGLLAGAAREALRLHGKPEVLDTLLVGWAAGDFAELPPVLLVPGDALRGAAGAYASSTGSIYLNQNWLHSATPQQAIGVLNEELGHHLDALLNGRDTPGDEGELFALLLSGSGAIDGRQRRALRRQNDHSSLQLADGLLMVEQAVVPNPGPSVSLEVTPAVVLEDGAANLSFVFSRSGFTTQPLTVRFSVGGSAGFGSDYSQSGAASFAGRSGTITFAAGASTATLIIDPSADKGLEANETVAIGLLADSTYSFGSPSAVTGTISNDDAIVSLGLSPAPVLEDSNGTLLFSFSRSGFIGQALTVAFAVSGSASLASDYSPSGADTFSGSSGTISFAAGASSATLTLDPSADNTVEANETVAISVLGGSGYTLGSRTTATGTISNDDASVSLTASPSAVLEDGSTNLLYSFSRSGYLGAALSVGFAVEGTASFGSDYSQRGATSFSGSAGTIRFAAGSNRAVLTLDPTADSNLESDETLALTLVAGNGYVIGTTAGVAASIRNDDTTVSLSLAAASVAEDGSPNLLYSFSRSGVLANALTVRFSVGGSASFASDYSQSGAAPFTASSGSLRFAAGAANATLTINPTADGSLEADETVILNLLSGTGYSLGAQASATGTISNDDGLISLTVSTATVAEDGPTNLLFTFSRTGSTSQLLSVNFNVGGSASYLTDFSQSGANAFSVSSGSISFAPGASTATLTLNPTADAGVEGDETVELSLSSGSGYVLGTPAGVSGTISNDDVAAPIPAAPAGTISQSGVVQAAIASAGEVDSFSLDTVTGAIIRVSVSAALDDLWPLIDLRDPQGVLLESAPTYNSAAADLGFWDLVTGKAVIDVRTQAGRTGDYNLNVAITTREELKTEVIRLTNLERQKEGLTPLIRNSLLDQAADGHVQDMDDHDTYLAHTGSNGSTPVDRIQATGYKGAWVDLGNGSLRTISSENAAAGQQSPAEVVTAWMNSPGHRAAIMDPATREIGVGVEYDNEAGRFYWIQNFGNPWSPGLTPWF